MSYWCSKVAWLKNFSIRSIWSLKLISYFHPEPAQKTLKMSILHLALMHSFMQCALRLIEKLILQRCVTKASHLPLRLQDWFMPLEDEFTSKVAAIFFSESSVHPLALSGQHDVTLICIKPSYWWVHRERRYRRRDLYSRDVSRGI